MGLAYLAVSLASGALLLRGPYAVPFKDLVYSDYIFFAVLLVHLACGFTLLALSLKLRRSRLRLQPSAAPAAPGGRSTRQASGSPPEAFFRMPEVLFVLCLVFFLFSYLYALNANLDYVQRFIAGGGALRLALDTRQERQTAAVKFGPLLLLNAFFYLYWRLKRLRPAVFASGLSRWALPLSLASALLSVLAFPSFVSLEGIGIVAFVALVPLLLVFQANTAGWGIFYGVSFAVLKTMLLNYWLATYSLVTLQLVSLIFLVFYALFFLPTVWLYKRLERFGFLVLPAAWVGFEYLRSLGFLGYPWGFWGTTQYEFITLVQIASVTGVWGISFIVVLINSGLAAALGGIWVPRAVRPFRGAAGKPDLRQSRQRGLQALLAAFSVFLACLIFAAVAQAREERSPVLRRVRLVLIQQNADPRKHDYRETFATLVSLTDRAVELEPDLVVWSETAFVPNIRRWSQMDPHTHAYAALVRDFLDYQKGLKTWLLTGNDDYELVADGQGGEVRLDYNAAVLFDPAGRRAQTYRKMRLVPFTENFPWKESLPGLYRWLSQRDVYLWEPGTERVVFAHPDFRFCTPICFEDAFPADVRLFVLKGAEAILNLSNDYWSLTEVEAKQHGVNAFFRAVENRVPLVRASASGLTGYIDSIGRLGASLPCYQESYLSVDVELKSYRPTVYTLLGDWFPLAALGLFLIFFLLSLFCESDRDRSVVKSGIDLTLKGNSVSFL